MMSPDLFRTIADDHARHLHRQAEHSRLRRHIPPARHVWRERAGWLLVRAGSRLVVPDTAPAPRPVARPLPGCPDQARVQIALDV
jgi:hypothetical protein